MSAFRDLDIVRERPSVVGRLDAEVAQTVLHDVINVDVIPVRHLRDISLALNIQGPPCLGLFVYIWIAPGKEVALIYEYSPFCLSGNLISGNF